uniref:Uncharacterized protein n=1 Tax=Panagrolaimus davidi TaxID=227884 RepID=A0A914P7V0_9BILA
MPAISLWLFLYLPLQILACMRTPIIDEQPAIPVTVAPVTIAPDPCEFPKTPPLCGPFPTMPNKDFAAPVVERVPGDCYSYYTSCRVTTPNQISLIAYCIDGAPGCDDFSEEVFAGQNDNVGLVMICNADDKRWHFEFPGYLIKFLYCDSVAGTTQPVICGPPPISGSPLPTLTPIPATGDIWNYAVTCTFPAGTTAIMDIYKPDGSILTTLSRPSLNSISTQITCYSNPGDTAWYRFFPIGDIKCRAA